MKLSYEKNPSEIIDKLLEHHDIKTLRGILNSKARKKEPRGNDFFTIAADVYLTQRWNDSKLEWAIDQIAEKKNISNKTIKNHITKFRSHMKDQINELIKNPEYNIREDMDVNSFIRSYIDVVIKEKKNMNPHNLHLSTYLDYKNVFDSYLLIDYNKIPF